MELHHIAFRTHHLEKLLGFYRDEFGFVVIQRFESSVWLRTGDSVLMLEQANVGEAMPPKDSLQFIAWRVGPEDYEQLRKRWDNSKRLEHQTPHTLYVRDPDGRRVGVSFHPLVRLG